MAVVLKEQLELRPSVALQKKVGLKSLEQVIRWGDRVNQELRRWRKLEDKKCWRARARRIRKKSRGGSSGLSKAQALVEIEQQERGYQKEVAKVRKWWLEALEEVEKIVQPEEKLIVWSAEDQEQRRRERAVEYLISASGPLSLPDSSREEREGWLVKWWDLRAQLVRAIKSKEDLKKCGVSQSKNRLLLFGEAAGLCAIVGWAPLGLPKAGELWRREQPIIILRA